MIHTYLCRAPRTTTTTDTGTTAGASTVLPSDQPTNPSPSLSLSLSPEHSHSRFLSFSRSFFLARLAAGSVLPLALTASEDQAGKQEAEADRVPLAFASVWVANQDAKVRIPSTRRFHVAVENHHEDAT